MTRYVILTGDETRADLCAAISNLRDRQRHALIKSTRDELDADINELLDMLEVTP